MNNSQTILFSQYNAGMKTRRIQYINHIKQTLQNKTMPLIIYGAGYIGRKLLALLQQYEIQVHYFCVSDVKMNMKNIKGCPVLSIHDAVNIKNAFFLIAALPPANKEMVNHLRQCEIDTYLDIPSDIRYIVDEVAWRPILEITSRIGCKVHCRYCPQEVLLKAYRHKAAPRVLSMNVFKTCIDKTPQALMLDFAGYAEPFLNSDIISMMEYAAQSGRDMRLFTTLVGLTEKRLDKVLKLPFRYVVLHLPDCQRFSNIPLTNDYFRLLTRILNAKKADGSPFVDKANAQAAPAPEVVPYLKDITVYQDLVDWAGNISTSELRSTSGVTGRIMCEYAVRQNHNILLPDGSVVLCCMDWSMKHVLGNLYKQSYEELMNSVEKQVIQKEMNKDIGEQNILCRKCTNTISIDSSKVSAYNCNTLGVMP